MNTHWGRFASDVASALAEADRIQVGPRIWQHDPSLWKTDPAHQAIIANALGWLTVVDQVAADIAHLIAFRREVRQAGFTDAVLLGMGGSSLVSDVLTHSFSPGPEGLRLWVLDTTHPDAIAQLRDQLPLRETLFIVASKSGTTTEPNAFYHYFWDLVSQLSEEPGAHFVAITDPDTSLSQEAEERHFRRVFLNPADIGGRYSALSWFGMVPAALMDLDVDTLVGKARDMMDACRVPQTEKNPGLSLGIALSVLARQGRDKITFLIPDAVAYLGDWLEQLLAESTGKEGTGVVPIAHEPLLSPDQYSADRVFVHYHQGPISKTAAAFLTALKEKGHPVIELSVDNPYDLAGEFFRWEFATAALGAGLGIDAFDQPNVQESKDNTKRLMTDYMHTGSLPAEPELTVQGPLSWRIANASAPAPHLPDALAGLLQSRQPGDYLAVMIYGPPSASVTAVTETMRLMIGSRLHLPTTFGYGPRFLHSTGQLHKGGSGEGLFIQIVWNQGQMLAVGDDGYDFLTLIRAQALGDYLSLVNHGRRVLRVLLSCEGMDGLRQVQMALALALMGTSSDSGTR